MASRRRARTYALQALYVTDLAKVPVPLSLSSLWTGMMEGEGIENSHAPESEEIEFATELVLGVWETRDDIDALIEGCSTNWRLVRMPVVDRNILRIAAYELRHHQDIPATVSMNEAVELAKTFGTAESRAFVNGIVDRMARQLGRISREHRRRKGRGR